MNTDDMRRLYEGLKIIFEDQTPETKEPLNGNQEANAQEGKEGSQEKASSQEAPTNRVPENEPGSANSGDEQPGPNSSTEPVTKPTSSEEGGGEPESADESDGAEEPESPREETPGEENASNEEEKEGFSSEEINQAVTIAEQLGLPQEPVENLFSLIDRDKLVNNNGEIGEEELTNTLKLLEAIVLRKPAKTPNEENYGYDPENARQSTGFGKYL